MKNRTLAPTRAHINRVLAFDGSTLTCLDLPFGMERLPYEKRTLPFKDRDETTSIESLLRMRLASNEVAILWNDRNHWTIHDKHRSGINLGSNTLHSED